MSSSDGSSNSKPLYTLQHKADLSIADFARRFLAGRIAWHKLPRNNSIINFGNIISMKLLYDPPFQVELFIVPNAPSSFTIHRHPNVDAVEFPLAGNSWLMLNGQAVWTDEQVQQWLQGELPSLPVPINRTDWHEGGGSTPYAFLSIQKWADGVEPTSVGIDWQGEAASMEQAMMWQRYMSFGGTPQQMLA